MSVNTSKRALHLTINIFVYFRVILRALHNLLIVLTRWKLRYLTHMLVLAFRNQNLDF